MIYIFFYSPAAVYFSMYKNSDSLFSKVDSNPFCQFQEWMIVLGQSGSEEEEKNLENLG